MSDIKTDNSVTLVNALAEIERLRGRVGELETMVKVFRGCIEPGVMPSQGSRCHKIAHELVGERDDA